MNYYIKSRARISIILFRCHIWFDLWVMIVLMSIKYWLEIESMISYEGFHYEVCETFTRKYLHYYIYWLRILIYSRISRAWTYFLQLHMSSLKVIYLVIFSPRIFLRLEIIQLRAFLDLCQGYWFIRGLIFLWKFEEIDFPFRVISLGDE